MHIIRLIPDIPDGDDHDRSSTRHADIRCAFPGVVGGLRHRHFRSRQGGVTLMSAFPETHIMLVNYGKLGLALAESEPGETFDECVQAIFDGAFGGDDTRVVAVYRTGLGITTSDVSEEACEALCGMIKHCDEGSKIARQFLRDHGYDDFVDNLEPEYDPDYWRNERMERARVGLL